jgi:hypothetical protein
LGFYQQPLSVFEQEELPNAHQLNHQYTNGDSVDGATFDDEFLKYFINEFQETKWEVLEMTG